jgi:protein SCO1/2
VRSLETYRVPPVVLVDQEGEQVALDAVLDGDKAVLVNFLFTSCTATCPVVTATVASMRQVLGLVAPR